MISVMEPILAYDAEVTTVFAPLANEESLVTKSFLKSE
jgi:hypothetical protein